eukprot:5661771-Pyramimonas_sp.AAC.1
MHCRAFFQHCVCAAFARRRALQIGINFRRDADVGYAQVCGKLLVSFWRGQRSALGLCTACA